MQVKHAFAVGRCNAKGTTVVMVTLTANGPIVGPWTLKAVVSPN